MADQQCCSQGSIAPLKTNHIQATGEGNANTEEKNRIGNGKQVGNSDVGNTYHGKQDGVSDTYAREPKGDTDREAGESKGKVVKSRLKPNREDAPDHKHIKRKHCPDKERQEGRLICDQEKKGKSESTNKNTKPVKQSKETWYSYLVLAVSFISCFVIDGLQASYGVIYQDLKSYYSADASVLSWPVATQAFMTHSGALLTSAFVDVYGLRTAGFIGGLVSAAGYIIAFLAQNFAVFTVAYGLGVGAGFAFIYLSACVSIQIYFDKRRSIATGVHFAGAGLGVFIMSPLVRFLLDKYSWRGCMLIKAGIVLQCVWLWSLVHPIKKYTMKNERSHNHVTNVQNGTMYHGPEVTSSSDNKLFTISGMAKQEMKQVRNQNGTVGGPSEMPSQGNPTILPKKPRMSLQLLAILKEALDFKLFKEMPFTVYMVALFFTQMGFPVVNVFAPDKGTEMGFSTDETKWFVSWVGIGSLVGKITFGLVGNLSLLQGRRLHLHRVSVGLAGLSLVVIPACRTLWSMYIILIIYGFASGGHIAVLPVALCDLFGPSVTTRSFGLSMVMVGIASLAATPLAGFVRDSFMEYDPVFFLAGGYFIMSMFIMLLIPAEKLKKKNDDNFKDSVSNINSDVTRL